MLSVEEIAEFWREGFVTIHNVVAGELLDTLKQDFEQWVELSREHTRPFGETLAKRPRFDLEPGHSREKPALRRVASPTELSDPYLDVLTKGNIPEMVSDLLGPDLRLHHSKVNSKLPGASTTVEWHQDFTFDPHSNDDIVTALLFLDEVTAANGPLRVAPGTHRGPLFSLRHNGEFTGAIDEQEALEFEKTAVSQTGPAGSVCFMHARTAHASTVNLSESARTLFIAAIAAADAVPLAANAVPSRHEGMLIKGTEPGRIRSTAFTMESPELPTGASFFSQQRKQ